MSTHTSLPHPALQTQPAQVGPPDPVDPELTGDALAERLFDGALAMMELATVHLGLRLGLYQTLQDVGPVTASQLASHVDGDERYLREWLEQQAMAELLICSNAAAPADQRRYELPGGAAAALLEAGTPAYIGPMAHLAVGALLAVPEVEEAFRTGGGVPFSAYGSEVRHGLGLLNGATFDRTLAQWITAMPDVDQRLRGAHGPAVLDLGCGVGRSALALARAYPAVTVHGIDLDAASVEEARTAAARAGLADRVRFTVADAAELNGDGGARYDLVTILEALHDMGDPVGALAACRRHLRDGGAVLVADQLTRDAYAADGDPLERFQYACSVLHCLPATRAEEHVVAHGTVIRASTVAEWAAGAGFEEVEVLDIEDPFWRFYRL
jgi:ubiquinone/menaquinone biosynthesis C-methylase UbiE